jgi:hypothetical protein
MLREPDHSAQNLPFPPFDSAQGMLFQRGLNGIEKILSKRGQGRFREFSRCHRVEFLNELRKHHISSLVKNPVWQMLKKLSFPGRFERFEPLERVERIELLPG